MSSTNAVPFSKWYVHFTLGPTGDRAVPGVYPFDLSQQMIDTLSSLKVRPAGFPWSSAGLVSEALAKVPVEVWSRRRVDTRVERAMAFMHANLNRKLTSEDVSRTAGVSVRNLSHLFAKQVQTSPMRALLDFRLDKACRQLRHTEDAIEQIAEDCGFPNRYYLSRMLKQHRGTSPAVYRKGSL
jgi:AraC-like DNA-binding protein